MKSWQFAVELNLPTTQCPCSLVYTHRTWKLTSTLTWTQMFIAALTIWLKLGSYQDVLAVGSEQMLLYADNGIVFNTEKDL